MVVLHPSPRGPTNMARISTCRPANIVHGIPVVDLSDPDAKAQVVAACHEFGLFRLVNHGVSMDFVALLESEAMAFFDLSQEVKDLSGPPSPLGYGCKNIGPNGDVGWVEYLLFNVNLSPDSRALGTAVPGVSQILRGLVDEYVYAVREVTCKVLEMIAEGLGMEGRDRLSNLIRDERSDSCFRVNHYPASPEMGGGGGEHQQLIGFGEHTDPQIMSVLRSNDAAGLQICLRDGSWIPVPPDPAALFFLVGDSLQVMTNGRLRSVKHRVVADGEKERVSMIYFGGPPPSERIEAERSVMEEGEESQYKGFTWAEYKSKAYKSRLGDNRLALFQKVAG